MQRVCQKHQKACNINYGLLQTENQVNAGMYTEEKKDSKIALSKIPKAQAFAITLEKRKRKRGTYYGEYVCNGRNLIR